jgi:hypothetical protein
MKLKLTDQTELEKYACVAFSTDKAGKNIIAKRFCINDLSDEVDLKDNDCYVHYPYREKIMTVFGENENH